MWRYNSQHGQAENPFKAQLEINVRKKCSGASAYTIWEIPKPRVL